MGKLQIKNLIDIYGYVETIIMSTGAFLGGYVCGGIVNYRTINILV